MPGSTRMLILGLELDRSLVIIFTIPSATSSDFSLLMNTRSEYDVMVSLTNRISCFSRFIMSDENLAPMWSGAGDVVC